MAHVPSCVSKMTRGRWQNKTADGNRVPVGGFRWKTRKFGVARKVGWGGGRSEMSERPPPGGCPAPVIPRCQTRPHQHSSVNGLPCRKRKRNPTMRRKGKGGKAGKGRRRGEERRGNVNPKKTRPSARQRTSTTTRANTVQYGPLPLDSCTVTLPPSPLTLLTLWPPSFPVPTPCACSLSRSWEGGTRLTRPVLSC